MIGFVDDSTGQVNSLTSNKQPHPDTLRDVMKYDAQLWSDLLWLSGGLLELDKCSFHQVHYNFAPGGTPIMRPGIYGNPLAVKDSTGSMVTIPAKSVYDSHKTLVHYKAPAGINTKQRDILHLKFDTFAQLVLTSSCDR
jgi:hypothetical protein